MLVFARTERPESALDYDGLVEHIISHDRKLLEDREPADRASLDGFREEMAPALQDVLGAEVPEANDITVERTGRTKRPDYWVEKLLIGRERQGDQIPAVVFLPTKAASALTATLIVHSRGKEALVDTERGEPGPLVSGLLERGQAVMAIDPFLIGEYNSPFEPARRELKGFYLTTFNPTDDALRVQDVLTSLVYLENRRDVDKVNLVGLENAGIWCLLARGLAENVARTAVDLAAFDPEDDKQWRNRALVPGMRRLGGLRTAAAVVAPDPLYICNANDNFDAEWIAHAYHAAGEEQALRVDKARPDDKELAEWLAASE